MRTAVCIFTVAQDSRPHDGSQHRLPDPLDFIGALESVVFSNAFHAQLDCDRSTRKLDEFRLNECECEEGHMCLGYLHFIDIFCCML